MKKIPGRIRAVLLVMAIAFSGVFLAPGTASAFNYDIKDTTAVCYSESDDGVVETVLVVNGLYQSKTCGAFEISSGQLKHMGFCANDDDRVYLEVACAEENPVIDWNDWVNSNSEWKDNNCLHRSSDSDLVWVVNSSNPNYPDCVADSSLSN